MIHKIKKYTTTNSLVILALFLGLFFGISFPELAISQKLIGTAFLSFLQMLVVPLVFASVSLAIIGLGNLEHLRSIGLRTLFLYIFTTTVSVTFAIISINVIAIGEATDASGLEFTQAQTLTPFSFENMVLNFIPKNIFAALTNGSMMQIIVFAMLFGVAALYLQPKERAHLQDLFSAISNVMLKMAEWVILLTPIGVFSLISYVVASQGIDVILGLWEYLLLVVGVLLLHALILLPLIYYLLTRNNPYRYLSDVRESPIMAFSTASSAGTLPVSMRVAQEMGDIDKKTASFVLPLGATISMDGTAAYLSIAVLYIATLAGVDLSFAQQMLLGLTVIALSVGVAALPSASLVMLVIILNQVNLPVEYIALIVVLDRILDMSRTAVNVTSDLFVAKIVDTFEKK